MHQVQWINWIPSAVFDRYGRVDFGARYRLRGRSSLYFGGFEDDLPQELPTVTSR